MLIKCLKQRKKLHETTFDQQRFPLLLQLAKVEFVYLNQLAQEGKQEGKKAENIKKNAIEVNLASTA